MALAPVALTRHLVAAGLSIQSRFPLCRGPTYQFLPRLTQRPSATQLLRQRSSVSVMTKWAEEISTTSEIDTKSGLSVVSHFDSGNIDVVDLSDPANVQLRIHPDPYCQEEDREHFQWFHYRIAGVKGKDMCMNILNTGDSSYPEGWPGYRACASYDRMEWFRVDTTYNADTGVLSIKHKPDKDAVYYAYFVPYTYERHLSLVAALQSDDRVHLEVLGHTPDGHDMELLRIGDSAPTKRKIWVIARQHPGESMAEWFVEGMLNRLLDKNEGLSRELLENSVFYVVPNMCPDGSWRGHLRTNTEGVNLNRAWADPTDANTAPEVYYVKQKMDEVGVDMFVDVHGDETVDANFLHGNEGIPCWNDKLSLLQRTFSEAFSKADPTFTTLDNYGADAPGTANLSIAARQIGERFKCLAFTIEMPFKDSSTLPDERYGWSDKRSMHLGAAVLNPIAEVLPMLR